MKYRYTVTTKAIFSRPITSQADSKEEIEQATGMTITDGIWTTVLKGKKGIVEDENFVLTIEKAK